MSPIEFVILATLAWLWLTNGLIDHVRWDPEEDLARVIGDAPAHTLAQIAQRGVSALKDFVKPLTTPRAPS